MDQPGKLSEMAGAEIRALEAEGIRLTPDEIVELNALGWAVEHPHTRLLLSRGRPVFVGGATLWPLTFRAVDWLEKNGYAMERASPAMGYAMAHGRSEGPEMDTEGRRAEKAVKAWVRRLLCTTAELNEAIRQVDDQSARPELPPDYSGRPMSRGDFVAYMQATCGESADFWERRCSMDYAFDVLTMFVLHNMADKKPNANDPKIVSERAFGWAVEKIRMSRRAEAIANGG